MQGRGTSQLTSALQICKVKHPKLYKTMDNIMNGVLQPSYPAGVVLAVIVSWLS